MTIAQEEIFGPVLGVLTVKSDEEALKVASNSKYGLHASVFTQDINRAFHLAKSLPCGTVSVNTFSEGDIKTPFGGYKQSGSLSRDQGTEALILFFKQKLFGLVIINCDNLVKYNRVIYTFYIFISFDTLYSFALD
jgi:aldehyde dehydrogenase (NAD+)/gamma-glutamyl-gamma-aminobutyraldehyde dehydrogenase